MFRWNVFWPRPQGKQSTEQNYWFTKGFFVKRFPLFEMLCIHWCNCAVQWFITFCLLSSQSECGHQETSGHDWSLTTGILYVLPLVTFINPRRACAARVTVLGSWVCLSVSLSVCYHVFCHHAQEIGQRAIVTGSVLHWLDFFKCSVLKLWRENQVNKPIC